MYNNKVFIQMLCSNMSLDKKDMLTYFSTYCNESDEMDSFCITKADVHRIKRFILHRDSCSVVL